jgi:hypothetical protein
MTCGSSMPAMIFTRGQRRTQPPAPPCAALAPLLWRRKRVPIATAASPSCHPAQLQNPTHPTRVRGSGLEQGVYVSYPPPSPPSPVANSSCPSERMASPEAVIERKVSAI